MTRRRPATPAAFCACKSPAKAYNDIVDGAGCSSAWLERSVRDAEVAGSNPVTPIVKVKGCRKYGDLLHLRAVQSSASRL